MELVGRWCDFALGHCRDSSSNLVGGLEPWTFMTFHSVGNVIIPTDELIFFRGVGIPPTRNILKSNTGVLEWPDLEG